MGEEPERLQDWGRVCRVNSAQFGERREGGALKRIVAFQSLGIGTVLEPTSSLVTRWSVAELGLKPSFLTLHVNTSETDPQGWS